MAKECKTILVPVDFSPDSSAAVAQALDLSSAVSSEIVLLHVVHDPTTTPGFYHKKKSGKKMLQLMSEAAEEMMADFLKSSGLAKKAASAGVTLTPQFVRGLPPAQIIKAAQKTKACMIIMGSSGRTGLSHLLLGSVAERVMQLSTLPVMVVKGEKNKK